MPSWKGILRGFRLRSCPSMQGRRDILLKYEYENFIFFFIGFLQLCGLWRTDYPRALYRRSDPVHHGAALVDGRTHPGLAGIRSRAAL